MTSYYHMKSFKVTRTGLKAQKLAFHFCHILLQVPVIWGILWGHENGDKCHISTSGLPRCTKFWWHVNWMITRWYKSPAKQNWQLFVRYDIFCVFELLLHCIFRLCQYCDFTRQNRLFWVKIIFLWLTVTIQTVSKPFRTILESFEKIFFRVIMMSSWHHCVIIDS